MPVELDEIERKLRQLEIEKQAVMKEDGKESKDKLDKIKKEMAELQSRRTELRAQWLSEKEVISKIRALKEQIEQTKIESEKAERDGDLTKASELKYGRLLELQRPLRLRMPPSRHAGKRKMLKEEVDEEDIAESSPNGPASRCQRCSKGKCRSCFIWTIDSTEGVGQARLLKRLQRSKKSSSSSGPEQTDRIVYFPRPTGVGRRNSPGSCRVLFDDENAMIRIDMSEYQERHTVSVLSAHLRLRGI